MRLHSASLHLLLFSLMVVATFIDIDDRIIPDTITIPGTLAGWAAAIVIALGSPARREEVASTPPWYDSRLASPNPWPGPTSSTADTRLGLAVGVGVVAALVLCTVAATLVWGSRGVRALGIIWARIVRYPLLLVCARLGVDRGRGGDRRLVCRRPALGSHSLSALVGTAVGGGLVWAVRLIGAVTLGREAMGFGDVTLMGMIGAFLGWQACLMIFFLAPFFGLLVGVLQWVFHGESEIPYGPYLCLATLAVIVRWRGPLGLGRGHLRDQLAGTGRAGSRARADGPSCCWGCDCCVRRAFQLSQSPPSAELHFICAALYPRWRARQHPTSWIETIAMFWKYDITDFWAETERIRDGRYGMIDVSATASSSDCVSARCLRSCRWPRCCSPVVSYHSRVGGDRCLLFYNQPRRFLEFRGAQVCRYRRATRRWRRSTARWLCSMRSPALRGPTPCCVTYRTFAYFRPPIAQALGVGAASPLALATPPHQTLLRHVPR